MEFPTLVQRQTVETTDVPDGFVEENGRFIPFWYSRVSTYTTTTTTSLSNEGRERLTSPSP